MFADKRSIGNPIVFADVTMTFGSEKLAFFMPENGEYTGEVVILDIGLSDDFTPKEKTIYETIESKHAATHLKRRKQFSNKGDYGNACLIAGSYGMMGAAVLSTLGCIRSGAGKVTCYTCEKGYDIIQSCVPEAMCKVSGDKFIFNVSDLESFNAIGIGPGIGRHEDHLNLLHKTFKLNKPLVIDADALNVLSEHQDLYEEIPGESILTPHPKEFERLFGKTNDNFEERELALRMAMKYNIFIILKGRYTCIATPGGKVYINKTGNPGMATGGSGDVLTGILTGFLAQRYKPLEAALLGVYLHGLAGDLAATAWSENSMIASDITKWLGKAFLRIENCREKILNKQVE
jgi:NAD(P)H-hydrate epimerase